MSTVNLWPEDLAPLEEPTPGLILRQQAEGLSQRTRDLVEGEVSTVAQGELIVHHFYARAPLLEYRLLLFDVSHEMEPYPAWIEVKSFGWDKMEAEGPGQLQDTLRKIFAHDKMRRTISQLRSYSIDQGWPFLLIEDGQVVGEAKSLALAMRKAREIVSQDSEIIIRHNGGEVASVRSHNGVITDQWSVNVPSS